MRDNIKQKSVIILLIVLFLITGCANPQQVEEKGYESEKLQDSEKVEESEKLQDSEKVEESEKLQDSEKVEESELIKGDFIDSLKMLGFSTRMVQGRRGLRDYVFNYLVIDIETQENYEELVSLLHTTDKVYPCIALNVKFDLIIYLDELLDQTEISTLILYGGGTGIVRAREKEKLQELEELEELVLLWYGWIDEEVLSMLPSLQYLSLNYNGDNVALLDLINWIKEGDCEFHVFWSRNRPWFWEEYGEFTEYIAQIEPDVQDVISDETQVYLYGIEREFLNGYECWMYEFCEDGYESYPEIKQIIFSIHGIEKHTENFSQILKVDNIEGYRYIEQERIEKRLITEDFNFDGKEDLLFFFNHVGLDGARSYMGLMWKEDIGKFEYTPSFPKVLMEIQSDRERIIYMPELVYQIHLEDGKWIRSIYEWEGDEIVEKSLKISFKEEENQYCLEYYKRGELKNVIYAETEEEIYDKADELYNEFDFSYTG